MFSSSFEHKLFYLLHAPWEDIHCSFKRQARAETPRVAHECSPELEVQTQSIKRETSNFPTFGTKETRCQVVFELMLWAF